MVKHDKALTLLTKALMEEGGKVFARWLMEQNPESAKTANALDFMNGIFNGKGIKKEDEYLQQYIELCLKTLESIEVLRKDSEDEERARKIIEDAFKEETDGQ